MKHLFVYTTYIIYKSGILSQELDLSKSNDRFVVGFFVFVFFLSQWPECFPGFWSPHRNENAVLKYKQTGSGSV